VDYAALLQAAIALYGEERARQMDEKQLRLMERQLNDVRNVELPDLPELTPEILGDSAVAGMRSDPALRANQLAAIAELRRLADAGGLDLTDRAALESALDVARNQTKRARAGVASDMASRGQLDSGARMSMDLDATSRGSNDLRSEGLNVAAMAQRRRLQAIRDASGASGALREQDWREEESANRAKDIRDERNAAARERAAQYNAGLPQQGYNNAMSKATGQLPSTSAVGNVLAGQADSTRALTAGLINTVGAYDKVNKNSAAQQNDGGSTYSYDERSTRDLNGARGGYADISDPDDK
jgi:hypothetical protein